MLSCDRLSPTNDYIFIKNLSNNILINPYNFNLIINLIHYNDKNIAW